MSGQAMGPADSTSIDRWGRPHQLGSQRADAEIDMLRSELEEARATIAYWDQEVEIHRQELKAERANSDRLDTLVEFAVPWVMQHADEMPVDDEDRHVLEGWAMKADQYRHEHRALRSVGGEVRQERTSTEEPETLCGNCGGHLVEHRCVDCGAEHNGPGWVRGEDIENGDPDAG